MQLNFVNFIMCLLISLISGYVLARCYSYKNNYTKGFLMTLALLPAIVGVIIMMVNGNIGTGVAVAGVFSLVRFRSIPGTAKEIGVIFIAMGAGLVFGMGYMVYGLAFMLILSATMLIYTHSSFGEKEESGEKVLTIVIPEDLNYTSIFDDIMEKYTKKYKVTFAKSTNMGSLFKITYHIELVDRLKEKEFIDHLRERNGNLEIAISPMSTVQNEL